MTEIFSSNTQKYGILELDEERYDICVKNTYFRYDYFSKMILKNINLTINKGEKVAIVGPSGSGKSTLLKLLSRLMDATKGEITIGNINIRQLSKKSLNKVLGTTLQEDGVLQGSLINNITLYEQDIDYEKLKNIYSIIDVNALGLSAAHETIISEHGANLSGGERQRISIGRLLYKEPKILLLDEPTSALDNISEQKIIGYLLRSPQTCIVVSHRFHDIEKFDRIIVMNDGEIVGDGRHSDLINQCDIYKKLYSTA